MKKYLPHAPVRSRRWLPKVLITLKAHRRIRRRIRYQDAWAFLAGGLAFAQDQHTEDLDTWEEVDSVVIQEHAAAGANIVTFPAPDVMADKHFRRASLSEEARYVLNMILNGPAEAMEAILTPVEREPTKVTIKLYLKHQGWPDNTVADTMNELTTYVMEGE